MKRFSLIVLIALVPTLSQGMRVQEESKDVPIFFRTVGHPVTTRNRQLTKVYLRSGATLADALQLYKLKNNITTNNFAVQRSNGMPIFSDLHQHVIAQKVDNDGNRQIYFDINAGTGFMSNSKTLPVQINFSPEE